MHKYKLKRYNFIIKKMDYKIILENDLDYYYFGKCYYLLGKIDKTIYYFDELVEKFSHSIFYDETILELCNINSTHIDKYTDKIKSKNYLHYYIWSLKYYNDRNYQDAYNNLLILYNIENTPPLVQNKVKNMLIELCWIHSKNFKFGYKLSKLTNSNDWFKIFSILVQFSKTIYTPPIKTIDYLFITMGPYNNKWNPLSKKQGGSETWLLELSNCLVNRGHSCIILNQLEENYIHHNGIEFYDISRIREIISTHNIKNFIVSRYSDFLYPLLEYTNSGNIHLFLHDISPSVNILPSNDRLKNIMTLTQWHSQLIKCDYHTLSNKVTICPNGIWDIYDPNIKKDPYRFIYSSQPYRGLDILLKMWKYIIQRYPMATLDIFCDLDSEYVNTHFTKKIVEVKQLLSEIDIANITIHGFVDKKTLYSYLNKSSIYLYTNNDFEETHCISVMEAAITKNLVIVPDTAGLNDVGKEGVMISTEKYGNTSSNSWITECLSRLFYLLDNPHIANSIIENHRNYILSNYEWNKISDKFINLTQ